MAYYGDLLEMRMVNYKNTPGSQLARINEVLSEDLKVLNYVPFVDLLALRDQL